MEEDIRLVVFKHLSDQLDVHILNVDLLLYLSTIGATSGVNRIANLKALVHDHDSFVQFLLKCMLDHRNRDHGRCRDLQHW